MTTVFGEWLMVGDVAHYYRAAGGRCLCDKHGYPAEVVTSTQRAAENPEARHQAAAAYVDYCRACMDLNTARWARGGE